MNRLAYLNFNAIFEFLGLFTIRCIYYIQKKKSVPNLERAQKVFLI